MFIALKVIRLLATYLNDTSKLEETITKLNSIALTVTTTDKTFAIVSALLHMYNQNLKEALKSLHPIVINSFEAYVRVYFTF